MLRHKFNAKPTSIDGIRFASKKEADYFQKLKLRTACGEIVFFLRQVPLHIGEKVKYVVDFVEFRSDGTVHFIDVKGVKTQMYLLKKKLVEENYPIEIEEV